jgi:hypothetical protein
MGSAAERVASMSLKSGLMLDRIRLTPDEVLGDGLVVWAGVERFRTQ